MFISLREFYSLRLEIQLQRLIEISQWSFLVPLIGGRYHIIPQLAVYKWYILPIGGLYGTYHLLREPETTIESVFVSI